MVVRTTTAIERLSAFSHSLDNGFGIFGKGSVDKGGGLAVRLIKNDPLNPGFKTMAIGDYIWMAEDLKAVKFRNGDAIPEVRTEQELEEAGKTGKTGWRKTPILLGMPTVFHIIGAVLLMATEMPIAVT